MSILLSYITVILIWTTTPLAIKWSSEGTGFIFAVSSRMVLGILAVLLSTVIYSFTAIKVKQHNQGIPALTITATGLMFAMPFYILSWYLIDGDIPEVIVIRAGISILHLAFFGSVIGFALFFYILKHVSAIRVSLITLVTPVTALLLGKYLNDEPLGLQITAGAILILTGLSSYEFGSVARWIKADPE
ncbi:MAG: hypothetical protein IEMM0001_1945 [bacterium]|nr:MAG: hypothetical protein IEMM0001_1945 [bacterium]